MEISDFGFNWMLFKFLISDTPKNRETADSHGTSQILHNFRLLLNELLILEGEFESEMYAFLH